MRQIDWKRVGEIEFAARKIKVHDKFRQAMLFLCDTCHVLREQRDSFEQNFKWARKRIQELEAELEQIKKGH